MNFLKKTLDKVRGCKKGSNLLVLFLILIGLGLLIDNVFFGQELIDMMSAQVVDIYERVEDFDDFQSTDDAGALIEGTPGSGFFDLSFESPYAPQVKTYYPEEKFYGVYEAYAEGCYNQTASGTGGWLFDVPPPYLASGSVSLSSGQCNQYSEADIFCEVSDDFEDCTIGEGDDCWASFTGITNQITAPINPGVYSWKWWDDLGNDVINLKVAEFCSPDFYGQNFSQEEANAIISEPSSDMCVNDSIIYLPPEEYRGQIEWVCKKDNSYTQYCHAYIDLSCGIADSGSYLESDWPPSDTDLCSSGTPSSVDTFSSEGIWNWNCVDGYSNSVSCSANEIALPADGKCGIADYRYYAPSDPLTYTDSQWPASDSVLCDDGSPVGIDSTPSFTGHLGWTCDGTNTDASCAAVYQGQCGLATSNTYLESDWPPSDTDLCSSGTPSSVETFSSEGMSWNCFAGLSGESVSCNTGTGTGTGPEIINEDIDPKVVAEQSDKCYLSWDVTDSDSASVSCTVYKSVSDTLYSSPTTTDTTTPFSFTDVGVDPKMSYYVICEDFEGNLSDKSETLSCILNPTIIER